MVRSSRFDLPFTYAVGNLSVQIGEIVRVPLGTREVLAFVVEPAREVDNVPGVEHAGLRNIVERLDVPRAFDETGLYLARFVAEQYLCTLGEALSAIVLSNALPRVVDSLLRSVEAPDRERYPSVPQRFIDLIWNALPNAIGVETLMRHPEARRAGDRVALTRYVQALLRGGHLRRERQFHKPVVSPYRVTRLRLGDTEIRGKRAAALVDFVRTGGAVPRADALLAGFSQTLIARAVKLGALREERIVPTRRRDVQALPAGTIHPTHEQATALSRIHEWLDSRAYREGLIYGVTGSGKTYVYVEAIRRVVREGGRAIVLVPEISLTPQTARRFEEAFGDRVAVLHSGLSERERFDAWQACSRSEIDVVVGARSAVFAPLRDVRMMVVDEAHETTYKQDTVPRYHAVAVARARMRRENGTLLLGSATPSLGSYVAAKRGKIEFIRLHERATAQPLPRVRVVDMGAEFDGGNRRIFSGALVQALAERIELGEKSVLFVNRRGSAGFILCRSCGFVPSCPRCSVSLSVHRGDGLLRCHYCDFQCAIPITCSSCNAAAIKEFGIGTETVVAEVAALFPKARFLRMDSDTTTHVGDHARILTEFEERGDILIGTQMVAKGLDFPTVTLVGVVAADTGLHIADFRAAERSFGLIAQVCGRSGRARPGEAIVQAYSPDHPAIRFAAMHDYDGFAAQELETRRELNYPPNSRLIYLGIISRDRAAAWQAALGYAEQVTALNLGEVLGPAPYAIAKLNNEWRFRIALKTRHPAQARRAIRESILPLAHKHRNTRLAINVDP